MDNSLKKEKQLSKNALIVTIHDVEDSFPSYCASMDIAYTTPEPSADILFPASCRKPRRHHARNIVQIRPRLNILKTALRSQQTAHRFRLAVPHFQK